MPVPLLLYGLAVAAGALAGAAGTYMAKEAEKKKLAQAAAKAETQRQALEKDVQAATTREQAQRLERIGLALKYIAAELRLVLSETGVALDRAVRLFACSEQLRVVHELALKGEMGEDDTQFVNLLVKNCESQGLQRHERVWLYDYLDNRQADATVRFLVDRFGSEHRVMTQEANGLRSRLRTLKIEIATLDVEAEASARAPDAGQRSRLKAELSATKTRLEEVEQTVSELNWVLVVAARFAGDAEPALDDENALRLLQQRARGIALDEQQLASIKLYGAAHFKEARDRLRSEFGVEILRPSAVEQSA